MRYEYDRVTYVDPHPGRDGSEVLYQYSCGRCAGQGRISAFDHVSSGICFDCQGRPELYDYTVEDARKDAKREVNRVNRARLATAKKKLASELAWTEAIQASEIWKVLRDDPEHPLIVAGFGWSDLSGWAQENPDFNQFLSSLVSRLNEGKALSYRQISAGAGAIQAGLRWIAERAEREAAKASVPAVVAGRQVISGKVYGAKVKDGPYGTSFKFGIRQVNGQTFWGTIPKALMDILPNQGWVDRVNGSNVVLRAHVAPAASDHTHGFYSRPTLINSDLDQS